MVRACQDFLSASAVPKLVDALAAQASAVPKLVEVLAAQARDQQDALAQMQVAASQHSSVRPVINIISSPRGGLDALEHANLDAPEDDGATVARSRAHQSHKSASACAGRHLLTGDTMTVFRLTPDTAPPQPSQGLAASGPASGPEAPTVIPGTPPGAYVGMYEDLEHLDAEYRGLQVSLAAAAPPSCRGAAVCTCRGAAGAKLEGKDAVKHAVMTDAKLSCTTTTSTGDYRNWLLGKLRNKVPDLASVVKQATEELAEVGLLNEDKDSKKRGRKVQFYRKSPWDELTDAAKSEAERLQIPRSVFE